MINLIEKNRMSCSKDPEQIQLLIHTATQGYIF